MREKGSSTTWERLESPLQSHDMLTILTFIQYTYMFRDPVVLAYDMPDHYSRYTRAINVTVSGVDKVDNTANAYGAL